VSFVIDERTAVVHYHFHAVILRQLNLTLDEINKLGIYHYRIISDWVN